MTEFAHVINPSHPAGGAAEADVKPVPAALAGEISRYSVTFTGVHAGTKFYDHVFTRKGMEIYAREVVAEGGEGRPYVVYFQGGPGFGAHRPTGLGGIIGALLKKYRVILLDQRGTGYSTPVDQYNLLVDPETATDAEMAEVYAGLLTPDIIDDAEALRQLMGLEQWDVFGQSYGGFCITRYLSTHPASVGRAFVTGGIPAIFAPIDDVYRHTFAQLAKRHEQFYREYPWAEQVIRDVCAHLAEHEEYLPTGERLSARRFRTIGMELGRGSGFLSLATLLERPFQEVGGVKRLTANFLAAVGARVSFEGHPLYAVIHESIYGGVTGPEATNWSAHRIREEVPGFSEFADPRDLTQPFYLTGEHIFPWQFEEDPALRPFAKIAHALAAKDDWQPLYHPETLLNDAPLVTAAIYYDDIFVPRELSLASAESFRELRPYITNVYQHNGIAEDPQAIFDRLWRYSNDH